jgi:hypothetical protein
LSKKSFDLGVLKPFTPTAQAENHNIYGKKWHFSPPPAAPQA